MGAGLVLELGAFARASWSPAARPRVVLQGDRPGAWPISTAAVKRVFGAHSGALTVQLRHELPIGQGFGMSAAGALAAALATAGALGRPTAEAIRAAHLAELEGGGGLGGVAAILGGGLEMRTVPGVPPFGRVRYRRFSRPIVLAVVGRPLASPPLLRSPSFLRRVEHVSSDGLRRLARRPDARTFLGEAERFADRLGLVPPSVARALRRLRRPDVRASQAMFGRSLFAVPLTPAGLAHVLRELESLEASTLELHAATRGAWTRSAAAKQAF